jgi:hypothetical protein
MKYKTILTKRKAGKERKKRKGGVWCNKNAAARLTREMKYAGERRWGGVRRGEKGVGEVKSGGRG